MLKYISIISILIGILYCPNKKKDSYQIHGTYVQQNDSQTKITFEKNSFIMRSDSDDTHHPTFTCNDTIAFGEWKFDNNSNFIRLQSPDYLINSIMDFSVNEKIISDRDSFYFKITNPIESHYKNFSYSSKAREVEYIINVKSNNESLAYRINFGELKGNEIAIKGAKNTKILELNLIIVINSNFSERYSNSKEFYTVSYEIIDTNSNYFLIDIPKLTYCQLGSKLMNQDFIKVIDDETIEWDGEFFSKKI